MKQHRSLLGAAALLMTLPAAASTEFGEHLRISGFGTLGVAVTDTDQAEFRADALQPRGATKSSPAFGVDSKLGLQADVKVNSTFSGVAQLLVSRRESDRPVVEWLYGQAALPADFKLRLGRMVLPVFMVSDSRLVGYASHWLRAPAEVYQQYPASSFDGAQVEKRLRLGSANVTAKFSLGDSNTTAQLASGTAKVDFNRLRGYNLQVEIGDFLATLAYTTVGEVKFTGLPLPVTKDAFTALGLQYDDGSVVARAEYVKRTQKPALFDGGGWYITAGKRFGDWTPYLTYSEMKLEGAFYASKQSPKTSALGLRWDAANNTAVKFQAQSSKGGGNSLGFIKVSPEFAAQRPAVKVYSLAVDFVF